MDPSENGGMNSLYKGHRFPAEIIGHGVWMYHRFTLSGDLLADLGIIASYETLRFSWFEIQARVRSGNSKEKWSRR